LRIGLSENRFALFGPLLLVAAGGSRQRRRMPGRGLLDGPKLDGGSRPIEGCLGHLWNAVRLQRLSAGVAKFENNPGALHFCAFRPLIYRNPLNHPLLSTLKFHPMRAGSPSPRKAASRGGS
jgi:hypothetical protein